MGAAKQKTFEALMGALVLGVFGAFFLFVYLKSDRSVRQGYMLTARFDNADGLVLGSDVRISGVKVGEVRTMTLDPGSYLSVVTFDVNPSIQLPMDSAAHIISDGFLGGKFLSLIPGESHEFLKPDQEVTVTQPSVNLEGLLSKFLFSGASHKKG